MARWQDSYRRGQRVEIESCGQWLPGCVSRKTATGAPVVVVALRRGVNHFAIDRKRDIRFPIPMVSP